MNDDRKPKSVPLPETLPHGRSGGGTSAGGILAGCGCLFAVAPFFLAMVSGPSGGDIALGVLATAPIGFIIAMAGMIVAVAGASQSKPDISETNVAVNTSEQTSTHESAVSPTTEIPPAEKPCRPLTWPQLVARVRWLFIAVFVVTAIVTVINVGNDIGVTWSASMAFAVCAGAAFPLLPASWSLWRALTLKPDVDSAEARITLHRLRAVQKLLAIGGGIWIPLLLIVQSFAGVLTHGMSDQPVGGWLISSGLTPMVVAIVAWIVLENFANRLKQREM